MKYIIFDMDGVLVNTEPLHFRIWKQTFADHGLEVSYDVYKHCIGSTRPFLFNLIKDAYGIDFSGDDSLGERFNALKDELIEKEGIPTVEGVSETIPLIKEKGYRLAIASSSPQHIIENQMETLGLAQYFDVMCSGEDVPNPKPAPDVFLKAARLLGADPSECFVAEDSYNGSLAAKRAGMTCLGFANPDSGNQNLENADHIFYPFKSILDYL